MTNKKTGPNKISENMALVCLIMISKISLPVLSEIKTFQCSLK